MFVASISKLEKCHKLYLNMEREFLKLKCQHFAKGYIVVQVGDFENAKFD